MNSLFLSSKEFFEIHGLKIDAFCFKKYEKYSFKKSVYCLIYQYTMLSFNFFANIFFLSSKNVTLLVGIIKRN